MHRIVMPDGTTRQSMYLRVSLAAAYLLLTFAGVGLLMSPAVGQVYGDHAHWYSAFMVTGGALAAVGTITMRWAGEFTGLPLLGSALAAFSVEILWHSYEAAPWLASANTAFFAATALVMTARWRVSLASYRLAHAVSQMEDIGHG